MTPFAYGLAVLSGLLLSSSMPGPDRGALAWVALVPLLWALHGRSPQEAFRLGWLAGFVYFGTLLYWVYSVWDWASFAIIPGHLILSGYLALYWGAFGALSAFLARRLPGDGIRTVAVPALWVVLEYVRALGRFGFPWGQAADALYQQLPFVQVASVAGIWGVSFLVVWVNALLFAALRARSARYGVLTLAVLGAAFLWGQVRLSTPIPQGPDLRIALVQPSIPQRIRGNPQLLEEQAQVYFRLLEEIAREDTEVDLVVLPESILPTFVLDDPRVWEPLKEWAAQRNAMLLFGTYIAEGEDIVNGAALLSPSGEVLGTYAKVQLVPFSTEYFPGASLWEKLGITRFLPAGTRLGLLTPGSGFRPIGSPWGGIATPICFESIFSRIARAFVRNGAEWILTVTNDAWFGRTWALEQHFAKGVFRAVETGRYFVQAANTGISGIIDPRGRILAHTEKDERTVLWGTVRPLEGVTPFVRYGDGLVYLLGLFLLVLTRISVRVPAPAPTPEAEGKRAGR